MSRALVAPAADPARWAPHPAEAVLQVRWGAGTGVGAAGEPRPVTAGPEAAPVRSPYGWTPVRGAERTWLESPLAVAHRGTQREHAWSLLARFRRRRHTTGSTKLSDASASTTADRNAEPPAGRHRGPASPEPPESDPAPSAGRHRRPNAG